MTGRILWVDDDPDLLHLVRRLLRGRFDLDTAGSGPQAIDAVASSTYAVVVVDMRMPGMDGAQLLAHVRDTAPDTVRIMFTGLTDQDTAIQAVNDGHVFRFIPKTAPPDTIIQALEAGLEQYRLRIAERELLEETLVGAVKALIDVLALTRPSAFGRATRIRSLVSVLARELQLPSTWDVEIAAMLSQLGCIAVPEATIRRIAEGRELSTDEERQFSAHPVVGKELLSRIPRLEGVAEMIAYQHKRFDGTGTPDDAIAGDDIPLGARILKTAADFEALLSSGVAVDSAILRMRTREGWYDPSVLNAFERAVSASPHSTLVTVGLEELSPGMILAEDVVLHDGSLVATRGQEVTPALRVRLSSVPASARPSQGLKVFTAA